ncbi:hypothetical protein PHG11b_50 [Flavobacterium phage 11b]|uniref:hypothetical protein n=1 Tax=Flavobacterium phage 11b TaxID=294631 RepID=UPI0000444150|nr:hypothetical protein PHG11b_50 [Flavobacterium phage 11b]CAH56677.1 hypothetical protein PHG11b_50 [Flavobacterium phage 11b]
MNELLYDDDAKKCALISIEREFYFKEKLIDDLIKWGVFIRAEDYETIIIILNRYKDEIKDQINKL